MKIKFVVKVGPGPAIEKLIHKWITLSCRLEKGDSVVFDGYPEQFEVEHMYFDAKGEEPFQVVFMRYSTELGKRYDEIDRVISECVKSGWKAGW